MSAGVSEKDDTISNRTGYSRTEDGTSIITRCATTAAPPAVYRASRDGVQHRTDRQIARHLAVFSLGCPNNDVPYRIDLMPLPSNSGILDISESESIL